MIISKSSKINLFFKAYGYWLYKRKLSDTQYRTEAAFKDFQYREVKKTLLEARHVPYYKALFAQVGFDPETDFNQLSDLEKIPVLTKDIIRKEYRNLINPRYKGIAVEYATSGSTGQPQKMLLTPYMVAMDKAMIFRHHSWCTNKNRNCCPLMRSLRCCCFLKKKENSSLYCWMVKMMKKNFCWEEVSACCGCLRCCYCSCWLGSTIFRSRLFCRRQHYCCTRYMLSG